MKIRDYYNENAQKYAESSGIVHPEIIDVFLSYMQGKKILDLGCGVGQDSKYFFSKGYSVIGIDFSEEMLKIAKSGSDIDFILQDMRNLQFEDGSFDGVWASSSLFTHLEKDERREVLQKISRILKPDGIFGGVFKPKVKEFPFNSFFREEIREELFSWRSLEFLTFMENGKPWEAFVCESPFS